MKSLSFFRPSKPLATTVKSVETLGIYIQIPFCASKCSFCNFSSRVAPSGVFDDYCRALEREIAGLPAWYAADRVGRGLLNLSVDTVYIGGGTPSRLGMERLGRILRALRRRFRLEASPEFTLEITPGSGDDDFLEGVREMSVNRLSIGAQTFDDRVLRSVGRLHSASETADLVRRARRAGFENISLDLIAGLPYQTAALWLRTLHRALELKPQHVSVYLFEIDEKSRLGGELLRHGNRYHAAAVPGDDFMADAYDEAREVLIRGGYGQYEISNFALPGYESRHNRKYWRLEPFVGLGAGAHSFDKVCRWANETDPQHYAERVARGDSPFVEICRLSPEEQLEEFFFLGLRKRDGIDLSDAHRRWGRARIDRYKETISALARDGWLETCGNHLALTDRALLISNEVFQEFLAT